MLDIHVFCLLLKGRVCLKLQRGCCGCPRMVVGFTITNGIRAYHHVSMNPTYDRSVVFSTNKTDSNDITEILLKMALSAINNPCTK